jgi:hypothetical protein
MPTAHKRLRRTSFDLEEMREALTYLLRVPDCTKYPDSSGYNGIMLIQDRMLRTDGNSMHVKTGTPSLSEHALLLSSMAGRVLRHALKKLPIVELLGAYKEGKKEPELGTILFTALTEEDVELRVGCSPTVRPEDVSAAWLPITEHSICITVDEPFLEAICTYVAVQTPDEEIPEVFFEVEDETGLIKYEGPRIPHSDKYGSIPIKSIFNFHPISIRLDAKLLKRAIQTTGKSTQLTLAPHPKDGFKNYHVNPVYVSSERRDLLALLSPIGDKTEQHRIVMEREGGVVDNACHVLEQTAQET